MGTMRGGGMGMGMRAERTPHGRSARAGQADLPKRKPRSEEAVAADLGAGGAAQGAAARRACA